MAKRKGKITVTHHQNSSEKRIPEPSLKGSTLHHYPNISFQHLCDRNCQLHEMTKEDLKQLSKFLRRISQMTWNQVRMSDGVKMKKIPRYSLAYDLPGTVSEDEEIFEMRVSQEHRIWGFQNQATFYVIWFDPTHSVCPV